MLAFGSGDGAVRLWDPVRGGTVATLLHRTAIAAIAAQNTRLAVAARSQAERETTTVQAACQAREEAARELAAAAIARAERTETALDAERAERRAITDRLTAVPAQARIRNRTAASPEKNKQHREDQHRPAQAPGPVR